MKLYNLMQMMLEQ